MMSPLPVPVRAALAARWPEAFPADGDLDPNGPLVPADAHYDVAARLKEHGYALYVTVVATHFPTPEGDTFEVATALRNPSTGKAFWWRCKLGAEPVIATLFPLFAGADWQEREQFDLVGVRFAGHPDLRRLMLPEDWEGHPLRKSYAIDTPHAPWR